MANYLELALQHLNEVGAAVLAHGPSADGTEYVVILDKGIKGGPKYRVALSILNSLAQKPKPQPKPQDVLDHRVTLPKPEPVQHSTSHSHQPDPEPAAVSQPEPVEQPKPAASRPTRGRRK